MSNIRMPLKWVNTSNLMMFEWCFLISKYHENCNAMLSFAVLPHVPWNTYLQCNAMFLLVCFGFYLFLLSLFSDTAGNKHSLLKFQKVQFSRVIFKKYIPILLQLKKYYVTFQNKNIQLRFKISMADASRYQTKTTRVQGLVKDIHKIHI